jgi:organic hydroperoxide reductase OsmC/OhrA
MIDMLKFQKERRMDMNQTSSQDQTEIRNPGESWAAAVRCRDFDGILQSHSSDIVMFDVPPPFQSEGVEAYEKTWELSFSCAKDPIIFDLDSMAITAASDVPSVVATSYRRDLEVACEGKPPIAGSSDPAFRGDAGRQNPEEFLVSSVSSCYKLWYLHLCSLNKITVMDYEDRATGVMVENEGGGRFSRIGLRPVVNIAAGADLVRALALHDEAHKIRYVATSVNFPSTLSHPSSNNNDEMLLTVRSVARAVALRRQFPAKSTFC